MKIMTKEKARIHLQRAIEHRNFWREQYVDNERDKGEMLDIRLAINDGRTFREVRRQEARENIAEANARIARFERIVK